MKDKIKTPKPIEDNTSIPKVNPTVPVKYNWFVCFICGQDLQKNVKKLSFKFKKYYKLCDKKICWNCVFNLVKMFKSEAKS